MCEYSRKSPLLHLLCSLSSRLRRCSIASCGSAHAYLCMRVFVYNVCRGRVHVCTCNVHYTQSARGGACVEYECGNILDANVQLAMSIKH